MKDCIIEVPGVKVEDTGSGATAASHKAFL